MSQKWSKCLADRIVVFSEGLSLVKCKIFRSRYTMYIPFPNKNPLFIIWNLVVPFWDGNFYDFSFFSSSRNSGKILKLSFMVLQINIRNSFGFYITILRYCSSEFGLTKNLQSVFIFLRYNFVNNNQY